MASLDLTCDSNVDDISSNSDVNTSDTNFDYKAMREIYMILCRDRFHSAYRKGRHAHKPYTTAGVNRYISMILKAKNLIARDQSVSKLQHTLMQLYEVIDDCGTTKLIVKRDKPNGEIIQVLGYENCFEIFKDVHYITGYGHQTKLMEYIKSRYKIPKECAAIFAKARNSSIRSPSHYSKIGAKPFNYITIMNVLKMNKPDDSFRYVLIYADSVTNYILLRPMITDAPAELSMELFKIFTDFGTPLIIRIQNNNVFLIEVAMRELRKIWPKDITIEKSRNLDFSLDRRVKPMLDTWIKKTGSNNWSIGCHVVQWKMNNTETPHRSGMPPYTQVFPNNTKSDSGIPTSPTPGTSSNTQNTEEDSNENKDEGENNESQPILNLCEPSGEVKFEIIEDDEPDSFLVSEDTSQPGYGVSMIELCQSEKTICHECNDPINNKYVCMKCKRSVHLFCGVRTTMDGQVTCISCASGKVE